MASGWTRAGRLGKCRRARGRHRRRRGHEAPPTKGILPSLVRETTHENIPGHAKAVIFGHNAAPEVSGGLWESCDHEVTITVPLSCNRASRGRPFGRLCHRYRGYRGKRRRRRPSQYGIERPILKQQRSVLKQQRSILEQHWRRAADVRSQRAPLRWALRTELCANGLLPVPGLFALRPCAERDRLLHGQWAVRCRLRLRLHQEWQRLRLRESMLFGFRLRKRSEMRRRAMHHAVRPDRLHPAMHLSREDRRLRK